MKSPKELILDTLKEKACLKQDVYKKTVATFNDFKAEAEKLAVGLREEMEKVDKDVFIEFMDKSDFEFQIKFGGDVLVFFMHTNVFDFDKSHSIWNSSYVQDDPLRSYCGMINIYNFLADSFKYNRVNDIGYLVARFFVNKDLHYFVEGKRQLGFLYNDFIHEVINNEKVRAIIESAILYSMDFDLLTPNYDTMKEVSVYEINEVTSVNNLKTGKRLGFKFHSDNDEIQ
ncbi:MAG: hypothetical protein COW67_08095 [Flavobacteriales bacterium CG18_big_fil_WC_8_21_14_2_50_32_9]|nr:MAG: hypothetical protein COW67_08095 [Flavobacteriales bacterium CG18_big_fil_WC_8_21_14_2_50_32_9]PJC62814.1 MAG: hypothetical protein CO022_02520 [Flavobacteriales bacterium CG_4_9_14_0_2_um_filter_32_27]